MGGLPHITQLPEARMNKVMRIPGFEHCTCVIHSEHVPCGEKNRGGNCSRKEETGYKERGIQLNTNAHSY